MDELVISNLEILAKIQKNQKLIINKKKIEIDNRYIQGLRRYNDGSNRYEIIYPICYTFYESFCNYNFFKIIDQNLIKNGLKGLEILCDNYNDFEILKIMKDDLWKKFDNLKEKPKTRLCCFNYPCNSKLYKKYSSYRNKMFKKIDL